MRPTVVGPGWDWLLWGAGGLSIGCSVLNGLAATNAAPVEWPSGVIGLLGLTLAGLAACEIDGAPEETPWYEYDGAFRGG